MTIGPKTLAIFFWYFDASSGEHVAFTRSIDSARRPKTLSMSSLICFAMSTFDIMTDPSSCHNLVPPCIGACTVATTRGDPEEARALTSPPPNIVHGTLRALYDNVHHHRCNSFLPSNPSPNLRQDSEKDWAEEQGCCTNSNPMRHTTPGTQYSRTTPAPRRRPQLPRSRRLQRPHRQQRRRRPLRLPWRPLQSPILPQPHQERECRDKAGLQWEAPSKWTAIRTDLRNSLGCPQYTRTCSFRHRSQWDPR